MLEISTCFTYAYNAGTYADFYEAITSAAVAANPIDLDAAGVVIGASKAPWLIVKVGTIFATMASLGIKLITDSVLPVLDAATAIDVLIWRFARARMTAGALLVNQQLPPWEYRQYITIEYEPYTNGTGSLLCYLAAGPEPAQTVVEQTVEAGT